MSSLNQPSFRFPSNIDAKDHKQVAQAIRTLFQGLNDHEQAFQAMGKQTGTVPTLSTSSAVATSTATEQIIQQTVNQTNIVQPTTGFVNDQTGATAYTTQQSDYGNEIVLNSSSPIAVTLNTNGTAPAIALPWYTYISNQGSGTATLTPATGTINGGGSLGVPGGSFGVLFFDGTNFELLIPVSGGSGVTQLLAGTGIALSPVGGTGIVTVTSTGAGGYSLGGVVTSANVTLGTGAGSGATIASVVGLDGNHTILIQTGTTPAFGSVIFTFMFTTARGNNTYPVIGGSIGIDSYTSLDQIPTVDGGNSGYYRLYSNTTPLAALSNYAWNVSCP